MLRTFEERVDCKHTALVIVDMQNDFCHENGGLGKRGLNVSMNQEVVTPLKNLINVAHSFSVPVIFIKMLHSKWTDSPAWDLRPRPKKGGIDKENLSDPICVPDSWGADWYGVTPTKDDYIVIKHRYGGFVNTDLDLVLRSMKKKTVIITGVDTTVCVASTARGALMHDYYVIIAEDCCGGADEEAHKFTLKNLNNYFGIVTTSSEIINIWRSQKK